MWCDSRRRLNCAVEAKRSSRGGRAKRPPVRLAISRSMTARPRAHGHKSPTLDTYTRLAMDLDEDILGTARMPGGRDPIAHRQDAGSGRHVTERRR